jgi:hypothetical protein
MNEPHIPIDSFERLVAQKGDTNAYKELQTACLDTSPEVFFPWAMLMANRYDYAPAYYDVFWSLQDWSRTGDDIYSMTNMDAKTKKMALEYLDVAAERNVYDAPATRDSVLLRISK